MLATRLVRSAALHAAALATALLVAAGHAAAQEATESPQQRADRIQAQVAEIRTLPFKHPVRAENQSAEAAAAYLEREMERSVPPQLAENFDAIVRKVGLYRGAANLDFRDVMKRLMSSQLAAYYDPEQQTFFVLFNDLSALETGVVYAHELYHGLQDQYFDLEAYVLDRQRGGTLNDDEMLARQAVVEGEATLVMTMWAARSMLGNVPARPVLEQMIGMQSRMDAAALLDSVNDPAVGAVLGAETGAAVEALDEIPRFVMETLLGAYLQGMNFVFEVQAGGWSEVEKLYAEAPPASTEQILHAEKWLAREAPIAIELPHFERNPLFADWNVLEQNALGEVQWRIVFAEHGLEAEAHAAAAGWNGDRYAVLRRKDADDLLLLLYTTWDTEGDAAEFAAAYERLLAVKYSQTDEPTLLSRDGRDVWVVEGGGESSLNAMASFVKSAKRTPPAR